MFKSVRVSPPAVTCSVKVQEMYRWLTSHTCTEKYPVFPYNAKKTKNFLSVHFLKLKIYSALIWQVTGIATSDFLWNRKKSEVKSAMVWMYHKRAASFLLLYCRTRSCDEINTEMQSGSSVLGSFRWMFREETFLKGFSKRLTNSDILMYPLADK